LKRSRELRTDNRLFFSPVCTSFLKKSSTSAPCIEDKAREK
jgi:hypothetical protein